jgi:hypothetical protein
VAIAYKLDTPLISNRLSSPSTSFLTDARRIDDSFKNNDVLIYIFLIYKRRKTEYTSAFRELRNKIPLNFI